MAYGSYFSNGYTPYYPTQNMQNVPMTQQNPPTGGIVWVQGEAGAKSYLVAPNTTVQLWDSEAQVIYLKSADASGMPSIKTLDYTIRDLPTQNTPTQKVAYATKDELTVLQEEINKLKKEFRHGESSVQNANITDTE